MVLNKSTAPYINFKVLVALSR